MNKKDFHAPNKKGSSVFGESSFDNSGSRGFKTSVSNTGSYPSSLRKIRKSEESPNYRVAKIVLTAISGILMIILVGVTVWLVKARFFPSQPAAENAPSQETVQSAEPAEEQAEPADLSKIKIAPLEVTSTVKEGIGRSALLHTTIPTRPRTNVISYTVAKGDNLFSIGEKFGVKPETVLWSNYDILQDNYRLLKIGQVLNVLPINGVYYKWKDGDNLNKVATSFKVDAMSILEYAGNRFDLSKSTVADPGIKKDTWIIVPGGKRPIKDWGPPAITRDNPAVAKYYGGGSCGKITSGAVGTGGFVWPVPSNHTISGYDFTDIHQGIDIGGNIGAAVVAADSGVVVYAGWSDFGYGNLLVIDHGNGWQTAYGHLNAIGATCGQSVSQGGTVATLGSTGNSTGPHLHFEMKFNSANANPHDFIQ
jgi:murein DD-endopeptidase MepM/ murein hydrolase activator NlpD